MKLEREIFEYPLYDVVVAGGGPAGIGAGIAAAREGLKTILIESNCCLGGVSTAGALPFYLGAYSGSIPFPKMLEQNMPYSECDRAFRAVGGIFEEMMQRMRAAGGGVGPCVVAQTDKYAGLDRFGCHDEFTFDIEIGKRVLDEMARDAGLEVLYYSHAVGCETEGNRIKGIYVTNKNGITYIPAKTVIDCTGDADIIADAGFKTYKGDRETGEMCHAGLVAHLEDIDSAKIEQYLNSGGDPWFRDICKKAKAENPGIDLPDRLIIFPMVRDGVYMINGGTSTFGIDGTSAEDRTRLTLWARQRVKNLCEVLFKKYIPGGEDCKIRLTAYYPGVRETRRIVGETTLTEELILKPVKPQDTVALAGRHFDLRRKSLTGSGKTGSQPFGEKLLPFKTAGIPYGALIPKDSYNVLAAGRCIAADGQALGPARIMSTCMATGEAAGTAAVFAVREDTSFKDVDIASLREKLRQNGAIVDL